MSKKEVYLSASRIKTAQQCSWLYWCKYILKLPDKGNDGASKGWICHLVFEVLGKPRRRPYYDKIIKDNTVFNIPSIKKMITKHASRLKVNDQESLSDMDTMILRGLHYDFFGDEEGEINESISEKEFNLQIEEGNLKYNIRGFIDKLFLYKSKKAVIRDFKTSKQKFKGKEIDDNMQDLMYCLAIKKLFPEYKSLSEFLFLRFKMEKNMFGEPGGGVIRMKELSDEVLEGFEFELTQIQNHLENFSKKEATSNFASDQGYPKDGTFGGPLSCGKDGFKVCKGEPIKGPDGKPIKAFICAYRKPFEYLCLIDPYGNIKKSVYLDCENELIEIKEKDDTIEKRQYEGCPAWNAKDTFEL
jgi:hypothetical protein